MKDVAADRHDKSFEPALAAADGERIEERLGRVLMLAVAGVDDGASHLLGKKLHGPRSMMTHDEEVGMHCIERDRGIEHGFALRESGASHGHVHDVGAEPLSGELEGALGASRRLEEKIDLGAPAQRRLFLLNLTGKLHITVGEVQQIVDFVGRKRLDGQEMLTFEHGFGAGIHQSSVYKGEWRTLQGGSQLCGKRGKPRPSLLSTFLADGSEGAPETGCREIEALTALDPREVD